MTKHFTTDMPTGVPTITIAEHRAQQADRINGNWIVINGEMCKWSEVDPVRWEAFQAVQVQRKIAEGQHATRMRHFTDLESALIEETRKRYPGA